MAQRLRNKIADINKHKYVKATLIDIVGGLCSVRIGGGRGNGGVLRGIPFIGPVGDPGQQVYVDYSSGKPIVQIFGQAQEPTSTRRPIVSRPVNSEPPSLGGTGSPIVADHVHDNIYLSGVSDAMYYDPTDEGFLAACTAAQSGDTIILPNGDFNGPVTLPNGVNLVGSGDTQVQYVLTTGGNNIIENIKFFQSLAGQQYCVDIPSTGEDQVYFYDCQFYNGNGAADIWLINLPHGGNTQAEFWNCFFQTYASAHNGYAFYSTVAHGSPSEASTKTFFCTYNIRCITSGTPLLWNSNCKIGVYSVSWGPTDLTPGSNVFYLYGDRYTASVTVDASGVTYTPAVLADWDGSADPGNVDGALDQLAERLTDVASSISLNLDDLEDVVITDVAENDVLVYIGDPPHWLDTSDEKAGWTATASAGSNPGYTIDGNDGNEYVSNTAQVSGMWVKFDLGSAKRITKVDIYTNHSADYVLSGKFQGSSTGSFSGEELYLTSSNFVGINGHKEVVFDQNVDSYRYYRLYLTGGDGYHWLRVSEVDFYIDTGENHWQNSQIPSDAGDITYTPGTLADWDSSTDPGDTDNALDQLAERTKDIEDVLTNTKEPTGFINRTTSTISLSTRTVTIAPTGTNFSFYSAGNLFTKTSQNVEIDNTTGLHYVYFDTNGTLQKTMTPWDIDSANVPVASVYWNTTLGAGILYDERHGIQMDGMTQEYLHETRGSAFASGMAGTFAANGSTITIGAGEWYDEDIEHITAEQTTCRMWYLIGSAWTWISAQAPYYHAVSSVPQYNNSGALSDVGVAKYSVSWVYMSNATSTPIAVIMGQAEYNTQALAEAATLPSLASLPGPEMILLYRVIWQRNGAVITWKRTDDYRRVLSGPATGYIATDHGALAGLNDLDHPASAITVSTTNFDNNLSSADDTVQKALETLDELVSSSNYFEPLTNGSLDAPELIFANGDIIMVGETP